MAQNNWFDSLYVVWDYVKLHNNNYKDTLDNTRQIINQFNLVLREHEIRKLAGHIDNYVDGANLHNLKRVFELKYAENLSEILAGMKQISTDDLRTDIRSVEESRNRAKNAIEFTRKPFQERFVKCLVNMGSSVSSSFRHAFNNARGKTNGNGRGNSP